MDNDPIAEDPDPIGEDPTVEEGMDSTSEGMDPFAQGVVAAATGGSLNDNRYDAGTDEHAAWEEGFMEKSREDGEDQPLVD